MSKKKTEILDGKEVVYDDLTPTQKALVGKDAPLTEQIYGVETEKEVKPSDVLLPQDTGLKQGVLDDLQLFINMYQPSEYVSRTRFRDHLLKILDDWKKHG